MTPCVYLKSLKYLSPDKVLQVLFSELKTTIDLVTKAFAFEPDDRRATAMRTRSPAAAERSVCLDNVGSFNYFLLKLTSLMRGTTRKTIFCKSKESYELPLLLIPRRHRSSYLKVQAPAHKAAWTGLRMGLCACVCVCEWTGVSYRMVTTSFRFLGPAGHHQASALT